MGPRLGSVLPGLRALLGRDPSYVDKDLKTELGRACLAPYSVRYCGRGNVAALRALAVGGDRRRARPTSIKQTGADRAAWRIDQGMTSFIPGLITTTFPTTNRPTYQQVISLAPKP